MATPINNFANITYKYGTSTDSAISNIATTQVEEDYGLTAIKLSNNSNWRPGENLTFSIRVENTGTEPLFGVSIQDNLGGNTDRLLDYIAGSAKMIRNDVITDVVPTNVSPLTMIIPNELQAGEVVIFTYIARVKNDIDSSIASITNELEVVGHEISASGTPVTVTPNPTVNISKAEYAEVRISKSVDKENVSVGDNLTYTFRLENSGNVEATNVIINDSLPTNFEVQSVTSETNGVITTFDATDYSIDTNNKLILPTSTTKTISVPAQTESGNGITTVKVVGIITT